MAQTKSTKKGFGFKPTKRLGQHFLRDESIAHQILERAGFNESDRVLEIGSGTGALTVPLAKSVDRVIAVEKDSRLIEGLRTRFILEGLKNVRLINADVLKLDLKETAGSSKNKLQIIGNIPYNISSPLLDKLIKEKNLISKAVLMFQLELANRLTAPPGNKVYGALTVILKYHARITPLLDVTKEDFYPKPKVGSMVVALDFENPHPNRTGHEELFVRVVKAAFAHRRKTLINSLKKALYSHSGDALSEALSISSINPKNRAETLDIDDFLQLSAALASLS